MSWRFRAWAGLPACDQFLVASARNFPTCRTPGCAYPMLLVSCSSQGPIQRVIWSAREKAQLYPVWSKYKQIQSLIVFLSEFGKAVAFNFCRYIYMGSRLTLETGELAFV